MIALRYLLIMYLREMLIINMRTWLICSRQNARLTAGAVRTLKVAHAARSMAALMATPIKPTTEPARVSNHQQIRYLVLLLLFLCWPALTIMISCCFFFQILVLTSFSPQSRKSPKSQTLLQHLMVTLVYQFFVSRPVAKKFCGEGGSEDAPRGSVLLGGVKGGDYKTGNLSISSQISQEKKCS